MNKNERPAFLKGKGAAVGAVLCFVAVITMVGSYTYNHYKKDMEQQIKDAQTTAEQLTEDDSTLANTDDILPTDTDSEEDNAENQESQKDVQQENENSMENGNTSTEEIQSTASSNTQNVWFTQESTLAWPASGATLLSFSMDHTVYFPTLEQYKYNPALIFGAEEGAQVVSAAKGIVDSITTNDETGTTIRMNLGDQYTLIYGQLENVAVAEGDVVERGQLLGYVAQPTKYYCKEGTNLYFAMEKDGAAEDPFLYLE